MRQRDLAAARKIMGQALVSPLPPLSMPRILFRLKIQLIAATHTFDQALLDTVIVKNVNPIEKLERSSLLLATTIHEAPAERLLRDEQQQRVFTYSAPALMPPLLRRETSL